MHLVYDQYKSSKGVDVQHIWDPKAGICDLSEEERSASSNIAHIHEEWGDLYEVLHERGEVEGFCSQRNILAAVETGQIEGLYDISRGVTETLIKEGLDSSALANATVDLERVRNLLKDQKASIDGIFDLVAKRTPLSLSLIKQLHQAITQNQGKIDVVDSLGNLKKVALLKGTWKEHPNNVTRDRVRFEYCPPLHVQSEMEKLLEYHNQHEEEGVSGEISAAWLHHRFTQIHPFQDGNGRMARVLASIVLLSNRLYPLVVQRDDKKQYIEALESADAGDLQPLIGYFEEVQVAEHKESGKALEEMPDGVEVAVALAEKRKERIAKTPAFKLYDLLWLVDGVVTSEAPRIQNTISEALSSKELTTRGLEVEVSNSIFTKLSENLPKVSELANTHVTDIEDTCVCRLRAQQTARNLTLDLDLHFRYDAFQHQIIGSAVLRKSFVHGGEKISIDREVRIPLYAKDESAGLETAFKQLKLWSKQLTTGFILAALKIFFP